MKRFLPAAAAFASLGIAHAGGLTLRSAFSDGDTIPSQHVFNRRGCTGQDISLPVSWSGAPSGTRSYALTLFDTDARKGTGFWHWIVADIPPRIDHLAAGAGDGVGKLPRGTVQGTTTAGIHGYEGPCPPIGDPPHHYHLTLYALKVARLPPTALASHKALRAALRRDTIAEASIVGRYGRAKP